jgi:hypothetical protein
MRTAALFALMLAACGGQSPLDGTWITTATDTGETLTLSGGSDSITGSGSTTDFAGKPQPPFEITGNSSHLQFHHSIGTVGFDVAEVTPASLVLVDPNQSSDRRTYLRAK